MKLNGWDTLSAQHIDIVNQVLETEQDKLVSSFDYRRDKMHIKGDFGPWRIARGGSLQLLHVDLFIRKATTIGLSRVRKPKRIAAVTVRVELPLRMVPSPDGQSPAQLRFDVPEDGPNPPPLVNPVAVMGADEQLNPLEQEILGTAVADCISQRIDQVGHVFAQTQGASWAATPFHDWANLITGDGRHYLAVLGAKQQPTEAMTPDRIDPELIGSNSATTFAASRDLFAQNVLLPWLNTHFRPKARFGGGGARVQMQGQKPLPPAKTNIGTFHPILTRLNFDVLPGGMMLTAQSETEVLSARLFVDVKMNMKFQFNAKTGQVSFANDPRPQVNHRVKGTGIFGWLIELIIHLVLSFSGTNITELATGIATRMQGLNNPADIPTSWTGARSFQTTQAKLEDCFWFSDDRPT